MATILVVEDELSIATLLRDMLEDEGYAVMLAQNGRAALDMLAASPPDLVVSDVMMPLLDGLQLCRMLAEHANHANIPLILMSALAVPTNQEGCHYVAFFPKPFDVDLVLNTIANIVGNANHA